MMRTSAFSLLVCLAVLSGCRTGMQPGSKARQTIPSYPQLSGSFDTLARVVTYGTTAIPRNGLATALKRAGYRTDGATDGSVMQIVKPDYVVEVLKVNYDPFCQTTDGCRFACQMTVRVRKPMTAACGAAPLVDCGHVFEVWSTAPVVKNLSFKVENGQYVIKDGKMVWDIPADIERTLVDKACANLLNIEGFRRALERK